MKPEFAIIEEREVNNKRLVWVDTNKAKYQGVEWRYLGNFGKRKFENLLRLSKINELVKVRYV